MKIISLIKMFGITVSIMITGVVVGVLMFCKVNPESEHCRRKIILMFENFIFAIFNTLFLGLCTIVWAIYENGAITLQSHYFMIFLILVLVTSSISFSITKLIMRSSKEVIEQKLEELIAKRKGKSN